MHKQTDIRHFLEDLHYRTT